MAAASFEVTVQPPDLAAAIRLAAAIVAIDLIAIRSRKATISRWCRHQIRHRPAATLTAAALLAAHLVVEVDLDPLRRGAGWLAHHIARGDRSPE